MPEVLIHSTVHYLNESNTNVIHYPEINLGLTVVHAGGLALHFDSLAVAQDWFETVLGDIEGKILGITDIEPFADVEIVAAIDIEPLFTTGDDQ
jgi:hypothetical protein